MYIIYKYTNSFSILCDTNNGDSIRTNIIITINFLQHFEDYVYCIAESFESILHEYGIKIQNPCVYVITFFF